MAFFRKAEPATPRLVAKKYDRRPLKKYGARGGDFFATTFGKPERDSGRAKALVGPAKATFANQG